MSWTDKKALEQIIKLRDYYNIDTFIETGTFKGDNAKLHANDFKKVITCEVNKEYYLEAKKKLAPYRNVECILESSFELLPKIKHFTDLELIYLDAHFYDPSLPKEDRWVVVKELVSLKNTNNCVIVIHDFDNGELGHLNYDGQPMNFEFLSQYLNAVNPNFHYYTNTLETCDILTVDRIQSGEIPNLEINDTIIDNMQYVWSNPTKTYRGLLYCTPTELDLTKFDLRKI